MNFALTLEQLLTTFQAYNLAIWPMQLIAYVLAVAALLLIFKPAAYASQAVMGILAFLWLWTGVVFMWLYWAPVYTPAYAFGALFLIQGMLFLEGAFRQRIRFAFRPDGYTAVGMLLVAYAMLGYPVLGHWLGHGYPRSLPFGLAPCPLVIFTFGLLLVSKAPRWFLVIPFVWAVSGVVPVSIGILEDIGLILAGIVGSGMMIYRDRKAQPLPAA